MCVELVAEDVVPRPGESGQHGNGRDKVLQGGESGSKRMSPRDTRRDGRDGGSTNGHSQFPGAHSAKATSGPAGGWSDVVGRSGSAWSLNVDGRGQLDPLTWETHDFWPGNTTSDLGNTRLLGRRFHLDQGGSAPRDRQRPRGAEAEGGRGRGALVDVGEQTAPRRCFRAEHDAVGVSAAESWTMYDECMYVHKPWTMCDECMDAPHCRYMYEYIPSG